MMGPFFLPLDCHELILKHVSSRLPEEACGLLAGKNRQVELVIPVENKAHSAVMFKMDEKAQISAFEFIDKNEMEMIGIFHSHPTGPPYPSGKDINEHAYPESLCLICSHEIEGSWTVRAYKITGGTAVEQEIVPSK